MEIMDLPWKSWICHGNHGFAMEIIDWHRFVMENHGFIMEIMDLYCLTRPNDQMAEEEEEEEEKEEEKEEEEEEEERPNFTISRPCCLAAR